MLAAVQNLLHILFAGAVVVACVQGGFKQLAVFHHFTESIHGDVVIPVTALQTHGSVGGVAVKLAEAFFLPHELLGHFVFTGAGGAYQHHDAGLLQVFGLLLDAVAVGDDLHQLQKLVVGVYCQHAGGLVVPGTAHENGVPGVGAGHIVQTVIKEDVHIDLVLPGAHIHMVGRDLREFLHDPLGPDAHKFRVHGGGDEHLSHLCQLAHEFLGALNYRLGAEKLLGKELKDHICTGAQLAPVIHLVDGQRGVKFILFVGQLDGVGDTFHQQIINVQRHGKAKFSVHSITSIS